MSVDISEITATTPLPGIVPPRPGSGVPLVITTGPDGAIEARPEPVTTTAVTFAPGFQQQAPSATPIPLMRPGKPASVSRTTLLLVGGAVVLAGGLTMWLVLRKMPRRTAAPGMAGLSRRLRAAYMVTVTYPSGVTREFAFSHHQSAKKKAREARGQGYSSHVWKQPLDSTDSGQSAARLVGRW